MTEKELRKQIDDAAKLIVKVKKVMKLAKVHQVKVDSEKVLQKKKGTQ